MGQFRGRSNLKESAQYIPKSEIEKKENARKFDDTIRKQQNEMMLKKLGFKCRKI